MREGPSNKYPNDPAMQPVFATPLVSDEGKLLSLRENESRTRWLASTVYYRLSYSQ
jgi:hypothetical protein